MHLAILPLLVWVQTDTIRFVAPPDHINAGLVNVSVMLQDRIGYMWFGSQDGLWCYDGYEVQGYRHDPDRMSIAGNWIKGLAEDEGGNLWVATRSGGLSRIDRTRTHIANFFPAEPARIETLFRDSNGIIWLGMEDGLARFDPATGTYRFFDPCSQPDHPQQGCSVISITPTENAQLLLGTDGGGLCRFDKQGTWLQHIPFPGDGASPVQIWCGLADDDGLYWFGSNHGVFTVDFESGTIRHNNPDQFQPEDGRILVPRMLRDHDGQIWIGTRRFGVCVWSHGAYHYTIAPPGSPGGLAHPFVRGITQDRGGIVWVGTLSGGVSKYNPNMPAFHIIQQVPGMPNSLSGNFVKSIYRDSDGLVWVGTNQGLDRIDPKTGKTLDLRDTTASDSVPGYIRFICQDAQKRFWFGTYGSGLHMRDNEGRFHHLSAQWPDPLTWLESGELIGSTLWIGSVEGLLEFDIDSLDYRVLDLNNAPLPTTRIRAIERGPDGRLYIGSHIGFTVFDPLTRQQHTYQHDRNDRTSLSSDTVRAVRHDSKGRLWLGTSSGLNRFVDGGFKVYGAHHGLANQVIYAIEEDDQGDLWVSTNVGLSRFDPEAETFQNFFSEHGLQGSEFNAGASLRMPDGTLYFGGINGITKFKPIPAVRTSRIPDVAISEFKVLDTRTPVPSTGKTMDLRHDENFFSFEFVTLDFSNPSRNLYSYKMAGVDPDWSQPSTRRFVNYPKLPPGEYLFRFRGANSDGVWNVDGAAVSLKISPPFYQRTWFVILAGACAATLIIWRIGMLNAQKQVLAQTVDLRTQSLQASNAELERTNHALKQAQEQLVKRAHEAGMSEVAASVVHNIGNILNSLGITAEALLSKTMGSRVESLDRVTNLLRQQEHELADFLEKNPRGQKLIPFLEGLSTKLKQEHDFTLQELERMLSAIHLIRETIQTQQDYAIADRAMRQRVSLREIVEDMLSLQKSKINQNSIQIETTWEDVPKLNTFPFRLAHIVTNILVNAIDAVIAHDRGEKKIEIKLGRDERDRVFLEISDNGIGIRTEHKQQLFTYGFTTKPNGRGIGLHSCANEMNTIGGHIQAHSEGTGRGARFTLTFESDDTD